MTKCAFGKILLRGAFEPIWPFGTELYARMLYLESGSKQTLLIALDTSCTSQPEANRFRAALSAETGIPADNIWYHELQIHAAPFSDTMTGSTIDELVRRISAETKAMIARAVPFHCRVAEAEVGTRFSMNREQYVEGLGNVTVFAGLQYDETGKPYTQDPARMNIGDYKPELPVFQQPIYFDNPVDSKAYLFVFTDEQERVLGTLSRFAAHPDVAVLFESKEAPCEHMYHYHFDWPGYLSEKLEKAFQAPSMYLNGPCGNLLTKKGWDGLDAYEDADRECRRIGEALADALLERYQQKTVSLGDPDHFRTTLFTIPLPMRDTFPKSYDDLPLLRQKAAALFDQIEAAKAHHAPAYQVKRLIDDQLRYELDDYGLRSYLIFDEETLRRHTVNVTIPVLELGDYLFIGVPGESLVDMTLWLRSAFTGVKTIPIDQVNGYFNYMATPATLTFGGYTYWCSWVSRDTVPLLKEGIWNAMEKWQQE